jgi:hypothetical protein
MLTLGQGQGHKVNRWPPRPPQISITRHSFASLATDLICHAYIDDEKRMLMNDLGVTLGQGQGHCGPQGKLHC